MKDAIIGVRPPNDGREWDCQCARCGSSIHWEECGACGGDGVTGPGELHEQDPLWYDPDDFEYCYECNGESSFAVCMSSPEWCEANPIIGREKFNRGELEWFVVSGDKEKAQ